MKFTIGFFIGLLTGITIILGPVIAVFVAVGLMAQKDSDDDTVNSTVVNNNVPPKDLSETDLPATPEKPSFTEGDPGQGPSKVIYRGSST